MDNFHPTAASIPPPNVVPRIPLAPNLPFNYTHLDPTSWLTKAALVHPNRTAVEHPTGSTPQRYTNAQFAQRAHNLAHALLLDANTSRADSIAILAPNTVMMLEAHFAIPLSRGKIVAINSRLSAAEVTYVLHHSDSRVLLVDHSLTHLVNIADHPNLRVIQCNDTGAEDCPYEIFLTRGRRLAEEKFTAARTWQGLPPLLDENAPISLNYTSGTTAKPKGVISTFRNAYLGALGSVIESRFNTQTKFLWLLPMFHASGWCAPWALTSVFATQVLLRKIDYEWCWTQLRDAGITHFNSAPTVQNFLVNHPSAHPLSLCVGNRTGRQPVLVTVAGSPPTPLLLEKMRALNFEMIHVYGMTECGAPVLKCYEPEGFDGLSQEDAAAHLARQGYAMIVVDEARVVQFSSESGSTTTTDELIEVPWDGVTVGEIVVRGTGVLTCYYKDEAATKAATAGNVLHSGDLAVRHPDGSIQIVDRLKDMIISGGENIASSAVEAILCRHPDVLEIAVIGRPDKTWGERPIAFCSLRPDSSPLRGTQSLDSWSKEFRNWARQQMAHFKVPSEVHVMQCLPRTGAGKVQKVVLRKIAADEEKLRLMREFFVQRCVAREEPELELEQKPEPKPEHEALRAVTVAIDQQQRSQRGVLNGINFPSAQVLVM